MCAHWLHLFDFSTVCFQMSVQSACIGGNKVALNAFVWPFPVCVISNACLRGGIFALVALIWLVSTTCFEMSVQSGYIRGYKVVLDESFVRLFCSGCFQMCSQTVSPRGGIVTLHWLHWFSFSLSYVFKYALKWPVREDAKSHLLHFFTFLHCGIPPVNSLMLIILMTLS